MMAKRNLPPFVDDLPEPVEILNGGAVLVEDALTAAKRRGRRFGDGDNFEAYWTKGPGLSRWVGSAHPFTTLRDLLREHPKVAARPGFAERLAATYYKIVKGHWPSERQGANPVGPG